MSNEGRGATKFDLGELVLVCSVPIVLVLLVLYAPTMIPPALLFFGLFLLFTRTRFGPRHFKAAIALCCGHLAGFGFALFYAASTEASQRVVETMLIELVVLGVLVSWLVLRPGGVSALLLGAYELVGIVFHVASMPKSGAEDASTLQSWLVGHIVVRLLVLASLWRGYEAWYVGRTPPAKLAAPLSPAVELKPLVAPSRAPSPSRPVPAKVSFNLKSPAIVAVIVIVVAAIAAACFALMPASLASECSSSPERDKCFNDLAVRTGDIGACRSMSADRIDACIVEVVTQATGDAADCKSLPSEKRAECVTELVRLGRPPELCAQALGSAAKKCAIEARKLGGAEACPRLPEELRAACVEASVPQIDDEVGHCPRSQWCPSLAGTRELSRCAANQDLDEVSSC